MKIKIHKIILFSLVVNVVIVAGLEWGAGQLLGHKNIYSISGLMDDKHPFMEFDEDLGYRIRKQAFSRPTDFFPMIDASSGEVVSTKLAFTEEEGIISNEHGHILINSLGFRGPYFEIERDPGTFRIVALGGSTTAGMYENALTYPRLLERMLNQASVGKTKFQVINAGMWGYDSCQMMNRYKKEIVSLQPDLILLMSGWNDINKIRAPGIKNRSQYCMNHHPILVHSNIFRFLRLKIMENAKHSSKDLGLEVLKENFNYYRDNLREVIEDSKIRGTEVILTSLPGLFEVGNKSNFSDYPQFVGLTQQEIEYRQSAVILINDLKKKLAGEYTHVSYVDNGMSPQTLGKSDFFSDTIHPTGAGNRVLAYQLFKYLNKKLKVGESFVETDSEKNWSKKKLELEYLKSIFISNRTEDLSFAGCLALHRDQCAYLTAESILKRNVYITGINEFVMGCILQYSFVIKDPDTGSLLENLMETAVMNGPDFSVSYWILGTLYSITKKNHLAKKYLEEAFKMNPRLRDFSFTENANKFLKNSRQDPFVVSFSRFIDALKQHRSSGNHFVKFKFHMQDKILNSLSAEEAIGRHLEFYYLAPLLRRSIFSRAVLYLKIRQKPKLAGQIIKNIEQLNLNYGLS